MTVLEREDPRGEANKQVGESHVPMGKLFPTVAVAVQIDPGCIQEGLVRSRWIPTIQQDRTAFRVLVQAEVFEHIPSQWFLSIVCFET